MPYTEFDTTKPAATETGVNMPNSSRYNQLALRDMVASGGLALGWAMTPSGGTAEEPTTILYSKGVERVRLTLTWTSNNVTKVRYEYSSNSGTGYDDMGANPYQNITYDGSGNVTGMTWGTS